MLTDSVLRFFGNAISTRITSEPSACPSKCESTLNCMSDAACLDVDCPGHPLEMDALIENAVVHELPF